MAEQGLADLSPIEQYRLSEGIEHNVGTIKNGVWSLKKMMIQIGGANDNVQLRERIHETQRTVNGLVPGTARDIRRLDATARHGDQLTKLQVERLTQAFRDALAEYSNVQKAITEMMAAHVPKPAHTSNESNPGSIADDVESALLANQQTQEHLVQETSMLLEKEVYINKTEDVVYQQMQDPAKIVNQQNQTVRNRTAHEALTQPLSRTSTNKTRPKARLQQPALTWKLEPTNCQWSSTE